ncbi:Heterokaryon incompatibility protein 6 [Diaporthe eres]|nr:Heterokaryon incompatibility protein 6 [Diaporthe eres]
MGISSSAPSLWQTSDCIPDSKRPESIYEKTLTSDGEFRLLQIEPAQDCTAEVTARLFKASLNDHPAYEAVSYRWEQTSNGQFIVVNGTEFPVMDNVISFLSEFRRQSYPSSPILWIDSVCINQSRTHDRDKQVQLMGEIYSKAILVRIWIGTESDFADQAFELVRHCGPADEVSRETVASNVIHDEVGTKALTKLLRRAYWNPMWVFQEIVLAKQAVVHCGELQAPWSNFTWLDDVSSQHALWLTAQVEHPWIFEFRKALFTIAHFCVSPAEACHINNVLHPTRHLLCQDPRDKLYALREVCEAVTKIVQVDYSMPAREVFTAFARKQLLEDRNLSSMLTGGVWTPLNGDDMNLPSWVPDLRGMGEVDIRYLAGSHMDFFDADGGLSSFISVLYSVRDESFVESDGKSILNVHAMLFDVIQSHRPLQGFTRSKAHRKALIEHFCLLTEDGKFSIGRLHQLFEGLIFGDKTTLMRRTPTKWRIQERARRLVLGFYKDLCQLFGPDPALIDFLEFHDCSTSNSKAYKSLRDEVHSCDADLLHLCQMEYLSRAAETTDRQATTLFLTIDGRLGVGRRGVHRNDVIVIAPGCRVLLALGQNTTYYKLVGPVYISGIMQGEAWGKSAVLGGARGADAALPRSAVPVSLNVTRDGMLQTTGTNK